MFRKLLVLSALAVTFTQSAPQDPFHGLGQREGLTTSVAFSQYANRQKSRGKPTNIPPNAEELLENPFFEEFFQEFNKQYRALENEPPNAVRTQPRLRPTTPAPRVFPTFTTTTQAPEPIVTYRPNQAFIQVDSEVPQPKIRKNGSLNPRRKRPRINPPQAPTRFQIPVVEIPEEPVDNTPVLDQSAINIASPEFYDNEEPQEEEPYENVPVIPPRPKIQTTPKPVPVHNNIIASRTKPRAKTATSRNGPKINARPKVNNSQIKTRKPETKARKPESETDAETFRRQADSAQYMFASEIDDTINGNIHQRQEVRDGKNVKGKYSYSDGFFKRTVHYEADDKGYRVVQNEEDSETETPVSSRGSNKGGKAQTTTPEPTIDFFLLKEEESKTETAMRNHNFLDSNKGRKEEEYETNIPVSSRGFNRGRKTQTTTPEPIEFFSPEEEESKTEILAKTHSFWNSNKDRKAQTKIPKSLKALSEEEFENEDSAKSRGFWNSKKDRRTQMKMPRPVKAFSQSEEEPETETTARSPNYRGSNKGRKSEITTMRPNVDFSWAKTKTIAKRPSSRDNRDRKAQNVKEDKTYRHQEETRAKRPSSRDSDKDRKLEFTTLKPVAEEKTSRPEEESRTEVSAKRPSSRGSNRGRNARITTPVPFSRVANRTRKSEGDFLIDPKRTQVIRRRLKSRNDNNKTNRTTTPKPNEESEEVSDFFDIFENTDVRTLISTKAR